MSRLSPVLVGVLVTTMCFAYGRHPWSWAAGPVAALFVWALDRKAQEPAEPLPEPAPVD